jgi:hypothetical protein
VSPTFFLQAILQLKQLKEGFLSEGLNVREYRRGNQTWTIQRNCNTGHTRRRHTKEKQHRKPKRISVLIDGTFFYQQKQLWFLGSDGYIFKMKIHY